MNRDVVAGSLESTYLSDSSLEDAIPFLIEYLNDRIAHFSAGGKRDRINAWENLPSDLETLQRVEGLPLEFEQKRDSKDIL